LRRAGRCSPAPRFVMVKPTLIYAAIGTAMLQRGWMNR
jgi:hypothetical protein